MNSTLNRKSWLLNHVIYLTDKILIIGLSFVKLSSFFLKNVCSFRLEISAKWILLILPDLPLTRETGTNIYFFNFTKLQFLNYKFKVIQKKQLFGIWQFDFIIQKFARLKSKHFSQFFWWEVNMRGLRAFILQKLQASVVERQKNKFCYPSLSSLGKKTLL